MSACYASYRLKRSGPKVGGTLSNLITLLGVLIKDSTNQVVYVVGLLKSISSGFRSQDTSLSFLVGYFEYILTSTIGWFGLQTSGQPIFSNIKSQENLTFFIAQLMWPNINSFLLSKVCNLEPVENRFKKLTKVIHQILYFKELYDVICTAKNLKKIQRWVKLVDETTY